MPSGSAPEFRANDAAICPWCVSDGSAYERFQGEFNQLIGSSFDPRWDDEPEDVDHIVNHLTPGFATWQGEGWWSHCGDAAEFLGPVESKELKTKWQDAIPALREYADWIKDESEWEGWLQAFNRDGSPAAYLFRCLHCGKLGGFWDFA